MSDLQSSLRLPDPSAGSFKPRPYQTEAIDAGVYFFNGLKIGHAIIVLPTGSGKSIVIANIAARIKGKTVILQPSKEILEQNYKKYCSYGFKAGIYSASAGQKHIDNVTFATIGSIAKKPHLFKDFTNIIIDECDLVSSEGGQYKEFIQSIAGVKVLGLTATPYRLSAGYEGAELKFLTRAKDSLFQHVLYYVQTDVLFNNGFLAPLEYYNFKVVDRTMLQTKANGSEFTEASVRAYYRTIDMPTRTAYWANRLLAKRKNLLIFCSLIEEAIKTTHLTNGAVMLTGEMDMATRTKILRDFTSGKIRCLVNVGVLTVGFDYPELETILIARSTMSLRLYYQIIGRVMRPHPNKKSGWVVDLGGNVPFFGKIEDLKIDFDSKGRFCVTNKGRQLTNVTLTKA